MEMDEYMFYGVYFKVDEVPKESEAYQEVLMYEGNDFVNHYLSDIFGNFTFGYHKPSKNCFLSLQGIYGETTVEQLKDLLKDYHIDKLEIELQKIQQFFGLNKTIGWYFLI